MSEKKHRKEVISIIDHGPVYICEFCHALLKVPDSCLREDEIQEEDESGPYKVTLWTFDCPKCGEENIADEDDGSEEGSDSEDEKKEKKEKEEKKEKKEKKERREKEK